MYRRVNTPDFLRTPNSEYRSVRQPVPETSLVDWAPGQEVSKSSTFSTLLGGRLANTSSYIPFHFNFRIAADPEVDVDERVYQHTYGCARSPGWAFHGQLAGDIRKHCPIRVISQRRGTREPLSDQSPARRSPYCTGPNHRSNQFSVSLISSLRGMLWPVSY